MMALSYYFRYDQYWPKDRSFGQAEVGFWVFVPTHAHLDRSASTSNGHYWASMKSYKYKRPTVHLDTNQASSFLPSGLARIGSTKEARTRFEVLGLRLVWIRVSVFWLVACHWAKLTTVARLQRPTERLGSYSWLHVNLKGVTGVLS